MNRDEVIRMAEESGIVPVDTVGWATCYQGSGEDLQRFAELVAAAERDECIENVRTIGGSFSVECEDLIRGRANP